MTYPLERSHWQAFILSVVWGAALLLVGVWILVSQHTGWRQIIGFITVIGAGLAAWYSYKTTAVGQLTWDGQVWYWQGSGHALGAAEYELSVALDFQNVMLLRLENRAHAKLWLWAERRTFPSRWLDFRRAVYSPRRSPNGAVSLA